MKTACRVLLATLLFAAGSVTARAQAPQQAGDPTKADSNTTKKDKKPKQTGDAAQTPLETPSASTAPASKPAAAPTTTTPASTLGSGTPASKPATSQQTRAATGGVVWVNTDSGIYHKPGTHWYGKTKHGKYMTEADAKKAGYRAAAKE